MTRMKTLLIAALAAAPAFAQCSMCRTALAGQGPEAARAMNLAVLLLLTPAVALFCGIIALAFWCAKPCRKSS